MISQFTRTAASEEAQRHQLDAEAQERAVSCLRLAYKIASNFALKYHLDRHECESAAVETLCRAAVLFNPALGVAKFSTYAHKAITRRMIVVMKRELRHRRVQGLHFSEMANDEDNYFDPEDRKSVPADQLPHEVKEMIQKARKRLPARMWEILHAYYAEGQSTRKIGKRLGISNQRVSQLLHEALRKARGARSPKRKPMPRTVICKRVAHNPRSCQPFHVTCILYSRGKPQSMAAILEVLREYDSASVKAMVEELLTHGEIVREEDGSYRLP